MPTKEAPFDQDGNMIPYPEQWRRPTMRAVEPFAAEMRVVGYERGRSAARFELQDVETGVTYPLFLSDLLPILQGPTQADPELRIRGTWEVSKRGANYGIKRVAQ